MKKILPKIICAFLLALGITALLSAGWYVSVYGDTGFGSILSTLFTSLEGAAAGLVNEYLVRVLLPSALIFAAVFLILFFKPKKIKIFSFYLLEDKLSVIVAVALSFSLLFYASGAVGLTGWVINSFKKTDIYEKEYVSPESTKITFPEQKRNLIYIYIESMETTFISKELGGGSENNLIPMLYSLAQDNINFSTNSGVGGWVSVTDTSWTAASIVAQTSGIPLSLSIKGNIYSQKNYLPGVTSVYDILSDNGYYQAAMFGSDSAFSGKDKYLTGHNIDRIYDWKTAVEDGIIEEGYKQWWGMEDKYLFEYAESILPELAKRQEPFSFSMLTSDTHHIAGYNCSLCLNQYSEQYDNVISCSDKQVCEFVNWLKAQDFYSNTTVVICGDHKSMDAGYFKRNNLTDAQRNIYNCILNSAVTAQNTKNRTATPFDMFPTTLSAMGCEIEGNRLGLGVNLFCGEETLAERYGIDTLNSELAKSSVYYRDKFVHKK